jgi:hypothetical protein
MSDEARAQVSRILENCKVAYEAVLIGERVRDGWKCDAWRVTFSRLKIVEDFDYFTGVGLRETNSSAMAKMSARSLRNVSKHALAWANHYKRFPGKPVAPHAADVLYSVILDSSASEQTFASWCDDFGYDTDSRKALATYEACQENSDRLAKVFDHVARDALAEALQDC